MTSRTLFPAFACLLLILSLVGSRPAHSREIVDMTGRRVALPGKIGRVYAPTPYASYILYAMDPTLLSGLVIPLHAEDKRLLNPKVRDLPVVGGLFGQGQTANLEVLLKSRPDLLLMWSDGTTSVNSRMDESMKRLRIPYAYASAASLSDYPDTFLFLGHLLEREQRGRLLSDYCRRVLTEVERVVKRIPPTKRPRVYYAEGVDGVETECDDSIHVELLKRSGDTNVHRCHTSCHKGMEKISLEQVMLHDPDVIIVQEKVFFAKIFKDPAWRRLRAVRQGRVYLVPRSPFNWFDRPPSFMRFLGLQWLTNILYPREYPRDMVREARNFYRIFLGVDVSERDMRRIMGR